MNHCLHIHSRLVKVIATNGTEMFACQCVTCGNKSTQWLPLKLIKSPTSVPEETSCVPIIRELIKEDQDRMQAEYEQRIDAFYRQRRSFYDNYLESPQWRSLGQKVRQRCGNVCESCHAAVVTEVHHLNYLRLGNELLSDLLGVCRICHQQKHPEHMPEFLRRSA